MEARARAGGPKKKDKTAFQKKKKKTNENSRNEESICFSILNPTTTHDVSRLHTRKVALLKRRAWNPSHVF
jgi:hypothetical protein